MSAEFKRLFRNDFLQITRFTAQILHFVGVCGPGRITGKPLLASFREAPLSAAQLSYTVFPTQAIQDDPDLLFG